VTSLETEETGVDVSGAVEAGVEPVPESGGPAWELLWVDPATLVVGANTRSDAALGKAFVGSIKDRGVREPIIVHRDEDGTLVVRKGQRRTLAAVQAGLDRVPVVVEPDGAGDEVARQVDRIIDQLAENQHRAGLPETDEVVAHQQLLDLGLTAGQIARRTRTGTNRVRTTLAVAGSEQAAKAMTHYHLSLDQAAVVAEFDDPDAVEELIAAATVSPGQFEHVAQRARDARAETQLRAELTTQLEHAGVRVIDRPEPGRRATVRALDQLRPTAESAPGSTLAENAHSECPGHVAWLDHSWRSDLPVTTTYGCEDWPLHGHAERWAATGQTASSPPAGTTGGSMSEDQKAERREVIANNRAWQSATTVRIAWIRQFLSRRTPPKDAATWIAVTLAAGSHTLRRAMEDEHSLARDLLGLGDTDDQRWYRGCGRPHPIIAAAHTATPARATVLALAVLLAAFEDGTSKNTWRHPAPEETAYLTALRGWGYELSEIEELTLAAAERAHPPAGSSDTDLTTEEDALSGEANPDSPTGDGQAPEDPDLRHATGTNTAT
jgi:ParB family transcriptional regulator, chromosome partitioning protein